MEELKQLLLEKAKASLGSKAWTVDLVLQIGVDLAKAVNLAKGLSGEEKSYLVCQTILTLLEDAEKADKERMAESTEKETTTIPWEACKTVAKTVLPTTLHLVISAARGEFADLQKQVVAVAEQATGVDIPDWAEGRIGQALSWCLPFCLPKRTSAPAEVKALPVSVSSVAVAVAAEAKEAQAAVAEVQEAKESQVAVAEPKEIALELPTQAPPSDETTPQKEQESQGESQAPPSPLAL